MDTLGVKCKQVLKQHVLKLIQEDKEFYEIRGLYEKGGTTIRATTKGELKIGPSVLRSQGLTLAPGDEFHLSYDGDLVILSKMKKDAVSADTGQDSPLVDDTQTVNGEDDAPPDGSQE